MIYDNIGLNYYGSQNKLDHNYWSGFGESSLSLKEDA